MAQKRKVSSSQDYGSDFDYDSEAERQKAKRRDLTDREPSRTHIDRPHKNQYVEERSRDESRYMRHHYISTNAYARHKELVNNYMMYYGGRMSDFTAEAVRKNDIDIIRENHQFVWEDGEEGDNWDKQLARKYYEKLYKEYCIADLSKYKENKVALRWRVEKEVINGRGQFICGNKKCDKEEGLRSWEINFAYVEHGTKKNTLVKLRLCEKCSRKLNYTSNKKEVTKAAIEESQESIPSSGHQSTSLGHKEDADASPERRRDSEEIHHEKRGEDYRDNDDGRRRRSHEHKRSKEKGKYPDFREHDKKSKSDHKDVRNSRHQQEMDAIVDGLLI